MIAVDTNLLVYAHRRESSVHETAAAVVRELAEGTHAWAVSPSGRLRGETDDFLDIPSGFVQRPRVIGGVVHDARVAAVRVAHGAEALPTRDQDFSLFPELRTCDPFASR